MVATNEDVALAEKGSKTLSKLMADKPDDVKVTEEVLIGVPEVKICLTAEMDNTDLIIMGTSGRGAWGSMFLGSVSYYTIHHAKCPVMLVK